MSTDAPLAAIEPQIVDEIFARSQAHENLQVLADDIGVRLPGTENEVRARDFLLEVLEHYGLQNVRAEPFAHRAWTAVHEQLDLTAPIKRTVRCQCALLSPSTPSEGLDGEVIVLDRGDQADFEQHRERIQGRFVLTLFDSTYTDGVAHSIPRQMKTELASRYGALGLIGWHHSAGQHLPAGTCAFGRVGGVPVASISYEDGAWLRRVAERKGTLRFRLLLDSRIERKESWNVVGEVAAGSDPPHGGGNEHIVLGAHYDCHHVATGAIDNAAGVVSVVETARVLAKFRSHLPRALRVVLFGVEEAGLVGSMAYVHQHRDELNDIVLMINNDALGGRPSGIEVQGRDELRAVMEPIAGRVRIAGEGLPPFAVTMAHPGWWGLDSTPFGFHGVPTVHLASAEARPGDFASYHLHTDHIDKVYVRGLAETAAINAQIVVQVANLSERPAARGTPQEVEAMIRQHDREAPFYSILGLRESLDLLDLWPIDHAIQRYFSFDT
jgi:hypothetical protein